jgi:hypothetical protein
METLKCKKHGLEMSVRHSLEVEGGTKYLYKCPEGCEEIIEDRV